VMVSAVLLWFGLSQIVMMRHGWRMMRARLAFQAQAADRCQRS
jgi:hypothetical protein